MNLNCVSGRGVGCPRVRIARGVKARLATFTESRGHVRPKQSRDEQRAEQRQASATLAIPVRSALG